MCPNLLKDARLYELLLKFDEDLFELMLSKGCRCGGALHRACYERKPRGAQGLLPQGFNLRHSSCCAKDGCRARKLPPSFRFLGRRVYLGCVVTLVTAMKHGVTGRRGESLGRELGVSRETLRRWREWWTKAFPATPFWKAARGMLCPLVSEAQLPASLLARFGGDDEVDRLLKFLDFIKPLTTGRPEACGELLPG